MKSLWPVINRSALCNEGTVRGFIFIAFLHQLSPHIFKHVGCKGRRNSSWSTSNFRQNGGQCWNVTSIIYEPSEEKTGGVSSGEGVAKW